MEMLNRFDSLILGTGNVLDNEEFKNAKTPSQEVSIFIDSRIQQLKQLPHLENNETTFVDSTITKSEVNTEDVDGIKVVVKIFVNDYYEDSIEEIIEVLSKICVTKPSVILAYHPTSKADHNSDKFVWGDDCEDYRQKFKKYWNSLRVARENGRISHLGVADIDLDTIQKIFNDNEYGADFTVLQINTQTCCVVPPELQTFCKERDIQLLTHSDPQVIFTPSSLKENVMKDYNVKWTLRYLETLVCRGILTKRSFIVKFLKA